MCERDLFIATLKITGQGERSAWLDRECASDAALRQRMDVLLQAFDKAGSLLENPLIAPAITSSEPGQGKAALGGGIEPRPETPGALIGPYKLMEQIGEGGMGLVFVAEQQQPVRRKVALKVIKPGMDSRQVIARFEAERQALALMDHPNIAKVHDGGATAGGRPYFVMELVKGLPITEYCDENRLTPRERLELFVHVCQAVQHAHQKGIIHRDIKPSNVLVASHDGVPVVKIIDFGVAKAVGQQLTERTLYTQFAQLIGTPLYMSPEQAGQSSLDVDTRSDIYSLGVLLYELLTGTTPFDKERFKEAGYDELRRIIREEEPPKPSTRISTVCQAATTASEKRRSDPRKLSRLFHGELDWIVMKALEKERNRRYETASSFAADVQRYLADEPVLACPPSARYRLGKFVRRNRGPVLAASLVLLALVGGVMGTSFGLLTAQRRLTQIEKATEILGSIFKDLNPDAAEKEGKPLQALLGERLDQASAQLEGEVIGDPLAVARMQVILGESQGGLGHAEKAILLFSKARTTFTAQLGADHPDTLTSMNGLASGYEAAGNFDLALQLFEETLERRKAKLGADHLDTLQSMNNFALGYCAAGKFDLALPLFAETLERRKAKLGPAHADTVESMNNLALGYQSAGKLDLALPLYEGTLKLMKAKPGPDHPNTLKTMNSLGMGYRAAGRLDLAMPLFQETLKRRKAKLGPDHPDVLQSMNNLALGYQADDKLDLALPLYKETLERRKANLPPDHPDVLQSMNNLAWGYEAAGKLALALPLFEDTLKLNKAKLGPDHPSTLIVMNNLGRGCIRDGQAAKAEPLLRECLAIREKKEPDGWRTFDTKSTLGAALLGQRKYSEAEPLLLAGYQGMKQREATIPLPSKIRLIEALERLVQLYEATASKDKAREWQKKLAEAKDKKTG
ncbi:MAG TPA: serine/threonine-protein kinase [Gemmataceae bacterium]|jgi:serine/threonine protein kinase/Tfp pilus assembly protein PilF|nr:serine/threonine-protein kinase [Gemmataceae bacterium]